MEKKVSVIIPVYNAEEYLGECLGNVVHQTLPQMEVILVNDASTDSSLSIMNDCKKQFPELVKVIDLKDNLGAGGARNCGIREAGGAYIGFVDSDDLIETSMYQKLYEKAIEGDYDMVDCGYYKQSSDLAIIHTTDEMTGSLDVEKRKQFIVSGGYICSKLFRRELFLDTNLSFRKNVILEDADFLTYLYATIGTVGNVKEVLYLYREQPNSSSKIKDADKYFHNIYEAMQAIYQKVSGLDCYQELQEAVEYELLQMYCYGVNICRKAYLETKQERYALMLKQLRELKKRTVAGGYRNRYVQNKISPQDIRIMENNDGERFLEEYGDMQIEPRG